LPTIPINPCRNSLKNYTKYSLPKQIVTKYNEIT